MQTHIFGRIDQADNLLPVAFPFEYFESEDQPFATVEIVPNTTADAWCGNKISGNILINIEYPANEGTINPTIEGEKFIDLFPESLVFEGIKIKDKGTVKNAYPDKTDNGRYYTPVVIKFEAFTD